MFGYIIPKACELKVCEFEEFKSFYCGLCKAVKKNYSRFATAFLSNDCVFFYLLFSSLDNAETEYRKNNCVLHGRKCRYTAHCDKADYAAALNVLLTAEKLRDDIRDAGKLSSRINLAFLNRAVKKAKKNYPEAYDAIACMTRAITELENEKCCDIDALASSFAVMLGKLFEAADEKNREVLYDIGYNLGRFIYITDAADDIEKDRKSGEFNVFLRKFGDDDEKAKESARFNLFISLAQLKKAFDSLTIYKNKGILLNIITLGLSEGATAVIKGEKRESI